MTRSMARPLMSCPCSRAMIFRSDSTRERIATVPTAAAAAVQIQSGKVHLLVATDSQGRSGVKVVKVSGETRVTW